MVHVTIVTVIIIIIITVIIIIIITIITIIIIIIITIIIIIIAGFTQKLDNKIQRLIHYQFKFSMTKNAKSPAFGGISHVLHDDKENVSSFQTA